MLKGDVFAEQVFENQIFALFFDTMLNQNCGVASNYKSGMPITYSGSNITIGSGAVCIRGRLLEEDIGTTINAGTDTRFCKLVIEIDLDKTNTSSDFLQGAYKILTSTTGYPSLTQTDIVKNVAGVYQYELAQFKTGSSGITDFVDKRTFLSIQSIYDAIESATTALLNDIENDATDLITELNTELQQAKDNTIYALKEDIYYQSGEHFAVPYADQISLAGYSTNNMQMIFFTIPLPKTPLPNATITINTLHLKARTIDGYVAGMSYSQSYDCKDNVRNIERNGNLITLCLYNENGWSLDSEMPQPIKNNTPVSVSSGYGGIDISFS